MDFATWMTQETSQWIQDKIALCRPDAVHLCDGSKEEYDRLAKLLVSQGTFTPLDAKKRPNSFLARSTPSDVARVEDRTFICSEKEEDAGPTNHWQDPRAMRQTLHPLLEGCMVGRTMYVIPFCMGPLGSPFAKIGIQLTDSAYVVCNMQIMTRMGTAVLEELKRHPQPVVLCFHSVGYPLDHGKKEVAWPCNADNKYIVHYPEKREVCSYGSGYGGNALLGKKCFALRIASVQGRDEGWLAEHMLIMGLTNPEGKKKFIAAAFPSSCGKTNLAMMTPTLPGWKVECVGDDIAWIRLGKDGRLWAVNPEAGFFGVAPGTSLDSNPNAMRSIEKNTIFTNTALTPEGDVWWEAMTKTAPHHLTDWQGEPWTPQSGRPAAHPNARFTAPARQCPVLDAAFDEPQGVPLSAIIFGGRRSDTVPLVSEAFDWAHGVFYGVNTCSETTAAAAGAVGKLRHDPFAMLPFCGYHMGDYFGHWLSFEERTAAHLLPKIFYVNWFLKDKEGKFLWPGYGENSRVLKWIFERTENAGAATKTPIGYIPAPNALDLSGLALKEGSLEALFHIDPKAWQDNADAMRSYLNQLGSHLPEKIQKELDLLDERLVAFIP